MLLLATEPSGFAPFAFLGLLGLTFAKPVMMRLDRFLRRCGRRKRRRENIPLAILLPERGSSRSLPACVPRPQLDDRTFRALFVIHTIPGIGGTAR